MSISKYAIIQSKNLGDSKTFAESVRLVGRAYSALDKPDEVIDFMKPMLEKYKAKNTWLAAFACHRLATAYLERGEFDLSAKHAIESKRLFEQFKDYGNLANAVSLMGKVYVRQNNYKQAFQCFDKAIA